MKLTDTTLFESLTDDQIDAENGVIRGVRILGTESKRGRTYSESARDDAVMLYAGVGVNINHPDEHEPYRNRDPFIEGFGELQNPRHDKTKQAVFADHHFPTSHPYAKLYVENARRFPSKMGFSHNADGAMVKRDGISIVESLQSVQSVDLVDRAATNKGLFESEKPMRTKTIKQIYEAHDGHPLASVLLEMDAAADIGAVPVDVPEEENEDPAADLKEAVLKGAIAILKKAFDGKMELQAAFKKIKEAFNMGQKMSDEEEKPAEAPTEPEAPAMESMKREIANLRESLKVKDTESEVRALLESEGRTATDRQFAALCKLDGEDRQELIESLPSKEDTQRPRVSRSRFAESEAFSTRPKDAKEFASLVE